LIFISQSASEMIFDLRDRVKDGVGLGVGGLKTSGLTNFGVGIITTFGEGFGTGGTTMAAGIGTGGLTMASGLGAGGLTMASGLGAGGLTMAVGLGA
jgi:hypothetical protein